MNRISPPAQQARAASRRVARAALALLFAVSIFAGGLAPVAGAASPQTRGARLPRQRKARAATAKVKRSKARKAAERASVSRTKGAPIFEPTAGEESFEEGEMRRERDEWFLAQRTYPEGKLPAAARRVAWESRPLKSLKGEGGVTLPSADAMRWEPLGPAPTQPDIPAWGQTSGRLNAIAFHPTDASVVLVGASTGGVWRSSDGGETFSPATDSQVDVAVGAIAFSRSHPNVVYAAMGDNDNGYLGTGLLKSTDGGHSWAQVARLHDAPGANCPAAATAGCLPSLARSTAVLVHPSDPNRVYLAQHSYYNGNATNALTSSGVYYSEDGGVNWTRGLAGLARDVAMHPTNPQILYAGLTRKDPDDNGPSMPAGVWRSSDGGRRWTLARQSPYYSVAGNVTRLPVDVRLAVTPAAPDRVYAYTGGTPPSGGALEVRVEVSEDQGTTWESRGAAGVDPGQFGYNTYINVHPSNPEVIYLGARDIFKSSDGGQTYTNLTNNFRFVSSAWSYSPGNAKAHPDQQAFAFAPGRPDTIFVGNDGGLYRSRDGGATFRPLNSSLGLTQFVGITAHPTDPHITYGGAQDNGSQRRTGAAAGTRWEEFISGDGGRAVVVPTDPGTVFSTYIRKTIFRWSNNGGSFSGEVGDRGSGSGEIVVFKDSSRATSDPAYRDRVAFYPPFVGNGIDRAIYFGTHRLWISTDLGASWTLPGSSPSIDLTRGGGDTLSAVGVARAAYTDTQTLYTGSAQGRVMVSTNGGTTWADRTAGLPNRFIEWIAVSPFDPSGAIAYLAVGGYGTGHVFRTTNRGATWADISGAPGANGLPNTPVSALLVDPSNPSVIYAGTDVGVYRSTSAGGAWESFNNGLPPTVVTSFTVTADGRIQLSTYGRGVYQLGESETATLQFDAETFTAGESDGTAYLLVRRAGNMGATVSVGVRTADNLAAVRCDDVTTRPNTAFARCDYATTVETVTFAPHEFVKSVRVPLVDDAHVEPNEDVRVTLSSPSAGATLGPLEATTLRITSDDGAGAANPLDGNPFFVRQQYLDFLSREPEQSGFDAWLGVLLGCPNAYNTDPRSPSAACDRVLVSSAFFNSQEFSLKGGYVFRFYKLTLGRLPRYDEIIPDMRSVTGQTAQEVFAKKADFAARWVTRADFTPQFAPLGNADFVNTLMGRYGGATGLLSIRTPDPAAPDADARVTLTRAELILRLNTGALTRAQVVRAIADSDEVSAAEFRPAFVSMQYFGYLRRDPEESGFQAWLNYLNQNPTDFYTMVNGFMNSPEYRLRFGKE